MLNSINCSTVIRLPTVILMLLREATSETYGPRVHHINLPLFPLLFILQSLLSIYIIKIPKIFILSYYLYQISLSQVAMKGLTTPLLRWLRGSYLFVYVRGTRA